MADFKSGRMASDLQRIISGMIPELKDPRVKGQMLTVVRCEVTRDRSSARVYISSVEGMERAKEAVKGLESASGLIRREVSNLLHLRKAPELKFIPDDSTEYSARISRILKELDIPKDDPTEDGEGDPKSMPEEE